MPAMTLIGIAIDDVRDIFGAPPEVAEALRSAYAAAYPSKPLKRSWGLFRRDPGTRVDPSRPLPRDVEVLLSGDFVPQDRVGQCWELLQVWLAHLAQAQLTLEYHRIEPIEFDLARRGLPSTYSISRLAERDLSIPLRPLPGMRVGYSHHRHAAGMARALGEIDPETLEESTAAFTLPLVDFLAALPTEVDVVVIDR